MRHRASNPLNSNHFDRSLPKGGTEATTNGPVCQRDGCSPPPRRCFFTGREAFGLRANAAGPKPTAPTPATAPALKKGRLPARSGSNSWEAKGAGSLVCEIAEYVPRGGPVPPAPVPRKKREAGQPPIGG